MLEAPPNALREMFNARSVRSVLSRRELQSASRALYRDPDQLAPIDADSRAPDAPLPPSGPDQALPLRVVTGYPPGFMAGAFTEAGCDVRRLRNDRIARGAELTLRRDGRAQRVSLVEAKVPQGCVTASRVLLVTYTPQLERPIEEGQREVLVLPFDDEFVGCQEADVVFTEEDTVQPGGPIQAPRLTRDVRPVYPPSAAADRVQGVVIIEARITKGGCVSGASVQRGVDPRLDWAALRALVNWRFDPAELGGRKVDALVSVSIQFSLR
jgi:TonB family protein